MTKEEIELKKIEFQKDLEARRIWHKKMNYHYLSYKGISLLNETYSREVLESLGMQIHIPRTFMTIESIRPDLDRPLDIAVKWQNRSEKDQSEKTQQMLKGEWKRSSSDEQKAKAQFDALLYGSGYLLSHFVLDQQKDVEVFQKYDEQGKPVYKTGTEKYYEGMKASWINPYYVIPDRKAKTYEPGTNCSPRRIWIPAIWDMELWEQECKNKGYDTSGMIKGGFNEELDSVKRSIDAIYTKTMQNFRTRDNGQLVSESPQSDSPREEEDMIGVVTEYTPTHTNIYAGANWTLVHSGKNEMPKKEIPIYVLKDYDVPGELEGVGEAEVLRWQQYEENKIHNLMYLQVILSTVRRYGIIESMLMDPTEANSTNPLKWIRLKYMPGVNVNDAIQEVNQANSSDAPLNVLNEVKSVGQMATGQSDYAIGSDKGQAGTLGEAEMMQQAGGKRNRQKIQEMEERGITPILESWLSAIPRLYTEELDYLLNDGTNKDVKFLPFDRSMDKNATLVAEYATREGVMDAQTIEEVFLKKGYADVVFVSDLVGKYDIVVKTSLAFLDKENMIRQYQQAIAIAVAENNQRIAMQQPPLYDTGKLTEELLRQFPDIIEDVEEYKIEQPPQPQMMSAGVPQAMDPSQQQPIPPQPQPNNLLNSEINT